MYPLNFDNKSQADFDKTSGLIFDRKRAFNFDTLRAILSMSKAENCRDLSGEKSEDLSLIGKRPGENIPNTADPGKGTPRTLRKSSSQANEPAAHHSCGLACFPVLAPLWDFTLSGFSLGASSFMRSSQAVSKTARWNGINASLSCSTLSCGAKKAGAFWVSIA